MPQNERIRKLKAEIARLQSKKDIEDIGKRKETEIEKLKKQKNALKYRKWITTGQTLKKYGEKIEKRGKAVSKTIEEKSSKGRKKSKGFGWEMPEFDLGF